MIYFIIFLLALLTFVTLLHLHFLIKTYIRFSVHWLIPQNNNINCPKFNSSTDRLRTVFSLLFFFTPLILFNEYNQLPYQNKIFHIIILTILIGSTCLLLYINKHKIWSKSFRTIPKKKNKIDLLINFIEGRLDTINNSIHHNRVAITGNKRALKNLTISANQNKVFASNVEMRLNKLRNYLVQNRLFIAGNKENYGILKNCMSQNNKYVSHLNEVLFETESKVDHVKSIVDSKLKTTNKEEIKSFESFFIPTGIYKKTIKALEENKFFEKSEITATKLTILAAKLRDLGIIYFYNKQNYLCTTMAKEFDVENIDEGYFSVIQKSFTNNSASEAHKKIFKDLSYLDKLI